MARSLVKLCLAIMGIYSSFLSWSLLQEPLNTRIWPNSGQTFQLPCFVALSQAIVATLCGYLYRRWRKLDYPLRQFLKDHPSEVVGISLSQAISTPIATYSLSYVDYLTYMLAKSCKLLPVLMVHLVIYRTPIPWTKKCVALLVTLGVTIFTVAAHKSSTSDKGGTKGDSSLLGFGLLAASLFLDGLTNAKQDKLFQKASNKITGAHLMFSLNLLLVFWNVFYLVVIDRNQVQKGLAIFKLDPVVSHYLLAYSVCGAAGQCFIFFTLEQYGSLVLVMVTVTRKMVSMLLSIVVYGHKVSPGQWLGIGIVFAGIAWESITKKSKPKGD